MAMKPINIMNDSSNDSFSSRYGSDGDSNCTSSDESSITSPIKLNETSQLSMYFAKELKVLLERCDIKTIQETQEKLGNLKKKSSKNVRSKSFKSIKKVKKHSIICYQQHEKSLSAGDRHLFKLMLEGAPIRTIETIEHILPWGKW